MALINVAKMLSRRLFSRGTRGVTNTGGVSKHIMDENLRSICARVEQATAEANQLRDECNTYYVLRRAFSRDRVIWSWFIFGVGINVVQQYQVIVKKRNAIKDLESQLSARRTEKQELRLPALSA
ncbi:hypothetical protein MKX03_021458 [Papaver bracteatum]|nr:hypothetical protein MKX03_021458 [Papaver bracteatum]